jgi:hypothetical protein
VEKMGETPTEYTSHNNRNLTRLVTTVARMSAEMGSRGRKIAVERFKDNPR